MRCLLLLVLSMQVSCVSSFRRSAQPVLYPPELEKAAQQLHAGKAPSALQQVESYLRSAKNIQWHPEAHYLKGRIHQSLGQSGPAEQSYRAAIRASAGQGQEVEAQSLYQLSLLYEEAGQMAELLASLIDLSGRRDQLDTPTAEVEIPARMAAAYAAMKNLPAAEQQHQRARNHYHRLMRQQREQLSGDDRGRMEYYLGLVVLTGEPESFASLLRKLELGQRYLLMATESGVQPWSQKAGEALSERWQQVWAMLQAPALDKTLQNDGLAQRKVRQRQQLDMASDFYDLLLKFEEERRPGAQTTGSRTLVQMGRENRLRLEKFARGLNIGPEQIRDKRVANRPLSQAVRIGTPEPKTGKTPLVPEEMKARGESSPGLPAQDQKPAIGDDPNL